MASHEVTTTKTEPLVSICLLTWNRASVISRSLDSLLAQTYSNFELIINDDCSTDDTQAICQAYEAKDRRVRYCRNVTNLKYSGNSNAAVERSKGDYILFAHDGDYYHPELVSSWVQAMQAHPSAALAFCALNVMDDDGHVVHCFVEKYEPLVKGQELLRNMLRRFDSPIFGITIVKRACLDTVGRFDSRFPRITDVDMWMRLLARFDAVYLKQPLIDVMPREKGHENGSGVNWKIIQQMEEIRETNIRRFFDSSLTECQEYLHEFRRDRRKLYLTNIFWCIRHGRLSTALEGIRRMFQNGTVASS